MTAKIMETFNNKKEMLFVKRFFHYKLLGVKFVVKNRIILFEIGLCF